MPTSRRALLALALPGGAVFAQPAPRRLIAHLSASTPEFARPGVERLLRRLQQLGHTAIDIEARYASGRYEALPGLAQELIALKPALFTAAGNQAAQELIRLTRSVPIVLWGAAAPVATGLVPNLARPGGNVTGTSYHPPEIAGKMFEALRLVRPQLARVVLVWNPEFAGMAVYKALLDQVAAARGIAVAHVPVAQIGTLKIEAIAAAQPQALFVAYDPVVLSHFADLIEFARQSRIPSVGAVRQFADRGGLMSFSPDLTELDRNVAETIDRILRGARPGDIPVREPSRFELVVNRKVAREIGIALPRELLLMASEVIE